MVTHSVFACLGDPVRWQIAQRLAETPLTVSRIASGFGISRPAISRHLRVLREAGIVSGSRVGRERLYRLEPEVLLRAAARLSETASGRRRELDQDPSRLEPARPSELQTESPSENGTEGPSERRSEAQRRRPGPDWRQW